MLESFDLPKQLYDPKSKVINFEHGIDYDNIKMIALRDGVLYTEPRPLPNLGKDIVWRRPKEICKRPFFSIDQAPNRFDALLGESGRNSWFVVAMEALTFNIELCDFVVPLGQDFESNYSGAFHFRLWQLGTWYDVVVDDRLPVYKNTLTLCYVHSKDNNVFWAALLEKAYCKICGRRTPNYLTYKRVGEAHTSMQDLTGGLIESFAISNPPSGRQLKWFLKEVFFKRSLAACDILDPPKKEVGLFKLVYLISGVYNNEEKDHDQRNPWITLIRLMNPEGHSEYTGDYSELNKTKWDQITRDVRVQMEFRRENDGEFWMKMQDFQKYFVNMYVCHLGPSEYLYTRNHSRVSSWKTKTFQGQWVKDFSAGGSFHYARAINPRFKMCFNPPDDAPKDSLVTVVMDITQRSPLQRNYYANVGFFLYPIKDKTVALDSFVEQFFLDNDPINDLQMDFKRAHGRAYVDAFNLKPGWYMIVACTEYQYDESSFLLRVFTESDVDQWEYDSKVSKSSPITVEPYDAIQHGELKHIFDGAARHEELDWVGLKDIFKRSPNALARSGSLQPSKGEIVFSKDECRSMIAMLDHDNSGKLNYCKFCNLWGKMQFWHKVYDNFKDSEGYIKINKLRDSISSIGFNLNQPVVHSIVRFYANEEGHIKLTDFILCGVILETIFTHYENNSKVKRGLKCTLEEWVKNTLCV